MNKEIIKEIQAHDTICIFRHEFADPDAYGSQFGLKEILLDNFPHKNIYALGQDNDSLTDLLYPKCDIVEDAIICQSLAIVLDTANTARIDDQRYASAQKVIKIDHHLDIEQYGYIDLVDTSACATSALIAEFAIETKLEMNPDAATYLYSGIIGDTGRFMYDNTTGKTLEVAAYLLNKGANIQKVYDVMYTRTIEQVRLTGYILDNFKMYNDFFAYYILEEADYTNLGVPFNRAKEYVNTLAGIEGVKVWMSATYNPETKFYHISIRSKDIDINKVAVAFGGGGHRVASGVKASTLERVNLIMDALGKLDISKQG